MGNGRNTKFWKEAIREGRSKEELNALFSLIQSVKTEDIDDLWICPNGPKQKFTVAWMRNQITNKNQDNIGKNRWNKWVLKKLISWCGERVEGGLR